MFNTCYHNAILGPHLRRMKHQVRLNTTTILQINYFVPCYLEPNTYLMHLLIHSVTKRIATEAKLNYTVYV